MTETETTTDRTTYHYGFNETTKEFVLWKQGIDGPLLEIDMDSAVAMSRTVAHVQSVHQPQPSATEPHDARVTEDPRRHMKGMVSEIEDGVLVAWDICARCMGHVTLTCRCADGPKEPEYIAKWREKRFQKSFKSRLHPTGYVPVAGYSTERVTDVVTPDVRPNPDSTATRVDDGLDKALAAVSAQGSEEEDPA